MRARRRRRKVLIGAALLLLLVLLVALLSLGGGDDEEDPGVGAGTRIDAAGTLEGSTVRVRLPQSVYKIVVTEPREQLEGKETFGGVERKTLPGATFVGLSFAAGKDAATPRELLAAVFSEEPGPVEIALRSGGRSYPIEVDGTSGKQWTAVAGAGDDLQVAVGFDGVTQVFDVGSGIPQPGPADPLYDNDRRVNEPRRCGRDRVRKDGLRARLVCRVPSSGQVSYVDELGWAEEGTSWAVVDLTTVLRRLRTEGGRDYKRRRVLRRVRLDGEPPLRSPAKPPRRGGKVYVFKSDFGRPMRLTMRLTLRGRGLKGDKRAQARIKVARRLTLVR